MQLRSNSLPTTLLAVCLLALPACSSHKYAVLLSTNQVVTDDVSIHSEWWYDLVQQYRTLKESGFRDDRIYVLYGDGNDFATVHPQYDSTGLFGHSITDSPMSKAEIEKVFQTVDQRMKKRDYLYVWWMGHGSGYGTGMCDLTMHISNTAETVTDDELKSYIDQVERYRKRSVSIMTCHSGGLVDEFNVAGEHNIVLASSTCAQSSYDAPSTCNGVLHAEFDYTEPNGLRQVDPCGTSVASDGDGDGWVSLAEAHLHNAAAMTRSTPQLGDPDSLAASTRPAKRKP